MSRARMFRPDYELEGPYVAPEARWSRFFIGVLWMAATSFIAGVVGTYLGIL